MSGDSAINNDLLLWATVNRYMIKLIIDIIVDMPRGFPYGQGKTMRYINHRKYPHVIINTIIKQRRCSNSEWMINNLQHVKILVHI